MRAIFLSACALVIAVGSAWGALVILGADGLMPVTQDQQKIHVAEQAGENVDNLIRWQGIYGQQLDNKRFRAEVWQKQNPGQPLPLTYRESEASTVREIDALQMRIEILKEK